jgi:uric acid transporter
VLACLVSVVLNAVLNGAHEEEDVPAHSMVRE